MKILFVSENYIPNLSGVPVVVKYLAEGLSKRGYQVSIATKSVKGCEKYEIINGVHVYRFEIYKNMLKFPSGTKKEFVDFVLNFEADINIIECTQCITTDLILPHLNELPGRRYFHVHGISGLTPGMRLFEIKRDLLHTIGNTYSQILGKYYFGYTLKRALPLFDATISLSETDYGIDYLQKYSKKNCILPNAAENMFFENNESNSDVLMKYACIANTKYMFSCANYTYIKNQLGIINQYFQSSSSHSMSLVCIGSSDNDYYYKCKQFVDKLNFEYGKRDVHLLYGVSRQDIPSILQNACLYLVGSLWEQYSISIIEAMSQGVPFISTDVGNARILPGGIAINSIEDMHNAIDDLMCDKGRWGRLSAAGKKYAIDNCRISVAVDKLERIISE